MPPPKELPWPANGGDLLSIEQLEAGLRLLGRAGVDRDAFWDEHIDAFRRTVLFAIRETSDALLSPGIPIRWIVQLEGQLETLMRHIKLADSYIARRSVSREEPAPAFQSPPPLIH
jgi:hypothetical protein